MKKDNQQCSGDKRQNEKNRDSSGRDNQVLVRS